MYQDPPSPVQRLAALKKRIQLLATGFKAVTVALAVVRRIKNELEKEHSICDDDDDTLKYLEKMEDEETKLRDKLVTLSGELDNEVHHVEEKISKLERKTSKLEMGLMKRNSNLEMQFKELKENQVELVNKNSKLEFEVKELNGEKVELEKRNSYFELQLAGIKEEKMDLEMQQKDQMKHMESEENAWKQEARRLRVRFDTLNERLAKEEELLAKEKELLAKEEERLAKEKELLAKEEELLTKEKELLAKEEERLAKEKELLAMIANEENIQQDVPPLQNWVARLPNTMNTILAPKGSVTGDEFGMFMGGFVNMGAYVVTRANRKVRITAMGALASLASIMISTMFNNIVTYILTVQNDQPRVAKAFTSLPWIMLGGVLPIAVGGFIQHWGTRAIVTAIVTLVLKIAFAIFLVVNYKVPKAHGVFFVFLGVLGMGIAAGVPDLL